MRVTPKDLDRWLAWLLRPLIVAGVVSLFGVAFYESWAALQRAATEAEIAHPQQWPWIVDGFILVAALVVADGLRSRGGRGWWSWSGVGVWWARLGMVAATALSTGIQAVYAPGQFPDGGWWLHAWNAPAVLFSFELLMWLVYGRLPGEPDPTEPATWRRVAVPDPTVTAAPGSAGVTAGGGVAPPVTGHRAGPGRAVAPHPDVAASGTRAARQRVAGSVPDAAHTPEPPTDGDPRPLKALDREARKRVYEGLRRDYRTAGLTPAQAAAKRGVPLDDVVPLWVTYADRYGAQPNGDHPSEVGTG